MTAVSALSNTSKRGVYNYARGRYFALGYACAAFSSLCFTLAASAIAKAVFAIQVLIFAVLFHTLYIRFRSFAFRIRKWCSYCVGVVRAGLGNVVTCGLVGHGFFNEFMEVAV